MSSGSATSFSLELSTADWILDGEGGSPEIGSVWRTNINGIDYVAYSMINDDGTAVKYALAEAESPGLSLKP
jgi:hypothetical protein